jgi:Flp pilus assembly protein TadG
MNVKRLIRQISDESGQGIIEIALSLSLLLMLIMVTIDFGYMFSTRLTLQNAVRQAGRYAITGQCVQSSGACSLTRYNSVVQTLETASLGVVNSSNASSVVTISCNNQGGGCPNNAGGPGDVVTISVNYPYRFLSPMLAPFFPQHSYTIKVSAAYTNEIFPPDQS